MENRRNQSQASRIRAVREVVCAVCSRPRAFTLGGSVEEICAWLMGLGVGLTEAGSALADEWDTFEDWLQKKLQYPRNHVWCGVLRNLYPDDATALGQLCHLYEQYHAEAVYEGWHPSVEGEDEEPDSEALDMERNPFWAWDVDPVRRVVDIACVKPGMLTLDGTFEEVCAYLDGNHAGLRMGDSPLAVEWDGFKRWLCQRLGIPDGTTWYGALRRLYPDDSGALAKLRDLYWEYRPGLSTVEADAVRGAGTFGAACSPVGDHLRRIILASADESLRRLLAEELSKIALPVCVLSTYWQLDPEHRYYPHMSDRDIVILQTDRWGSLAGTVSSLYRSTGAVGRLPLIAIVSREAAGKLKLFPWLTSGQDRKSLWHLIVREELDIGRLVGEIRQLIEGAIEL